jgi:hypothetical protein
MALATLWTDPPDHRNLAFSPRSRLARAALSAAIVERVLLEREHVRGHRAVGPLAGPGLGVEQLVDAVLRDSSRPSSTRPVWIFS